MISVESKGDFSKVTNYLERLKGVVNLSILDKYGREGVAALKKATPIDSGNTAGSWSYEIERTKDSATLYFKNSHVNNGCNIAVILQYGHGTRNGGWVEGVDYINPALKPIFQNLADEAWKEVKSL